jgi:hypothetical protein
MSSTAGDPTSPTPVESVPVPSSKPTLSPPVNKGRRASLNGLSSVPTDDGSTPESGTSPSLNPQKRNLEGHIGNARRASLGSMNIDQDALKALAAIHTADMESKSGAEARFLKVKTSLDPLRDLKTRNSMTPELEQLLVEREKEREEKEKKEKEKEKIVVQLKFAPDTYSEYKTRNGPLTPRMVGYVEPVVEKKPGLPDVFKSSRRKSVSDMPSPESSPVMKTDVVSPTQGRRPSLAVSSSNTNPADGSVDAAQASHGPSTSHGNRSRPSTPTQSSASATSAGRRGSVGSTTPQRSPRGGSPAPSPRSPKRVSLAPMEGYGHGSTPAPATATATGAGTGTGTATATGDQPSATPLTSSAPECRRISLQPLKLPDEAASRIPGSGSARTSTTAGTNPGAVSASALVAALETAKLEIGASPPGAASATKDTGTTDSAVEPAAIASELPLSQNDGK